MENKEVEKMLNETVCPSCGSEKVFKEFKKEGKLFINDGTEFTDEYIESDEIYCDKCGCVFEEQQYGVKKENQRKIK